MNRNQQKPRKRVPGAVEERARERMRPLKPLLPLKLRTLYRLQYLKPRSRRSLLSLASRLIKAKAMVISGFMVIASERSDVVAVERPSVMSRKTDRTRKPIRILGQTSRRLLCRSLAWSPFLARMCNRLSMRRRRQPILQRKDLISRRTPGQARRRLKP